MWAAARGASDNVALPFAARAPVDLRGNSTKSPCPFGQQALARGLRLVRPF